MAIAKIMVLTPYVCPIYPILLTLQALTRHWWVQDFAASACLTLIKPDMLTNRDVIDLCAAILGGKRPGLPHAVRG